MDMYQKREMRQEKKNNNNQEKELTKVGINCLTTVFPILLKNFIK